MRFTALAVLVAIGCGGSKGSVEDRKKEASREIDEFRRIGEAIDVSVRGDESDVLVYKIPGCGDGELLLLFGPRAANLDKAKVPDISAAKLAELGFRRVECESGSKVASVAIPYVFDPLSGRRQYAKFFEKSINASAKSGDEIHFSLMGPDETTLRIDAASCFDGLAKLALRDVNPAYGFKRSECHDGSKETSWEP